MTNKYLRTIYGIDTDGNPGSLQVDVYNVLDAYPTKNPALDHLIKKALCPGQRGHKDLLTDLDDIIKSAQRAKELVVNQMASCPSKPYAVRRPSSFTGKTLCYYPDKLHASGLLKTFHELSQKAEVPTKAVDRAEKVGFDGILVDGKDPDEQLIRHFAARGIYTYGVREANEILRRSINDQKKAVAVAATRRPTSFKGQKTIYAFPEKIKGRVAALIEAVKGVCGLEYIEHIDGAIVGSVVVGNYPPHEQMIDGRFTYSIAEALEILANDKL